MLLDVDAELAAEALSEVILCEADARAARDQDQALANHREAELQAEGAILEADAQAARDLYFEIELEYFGLSPAAWKRRRATRRMEMRRIVRITQVVFGMVPNKCNKNKLLNSKLTGQQRSGGLTASRGIMFLSRSRRISCT